MKEEIVKSIIENKMVIALALIGFCHASLAYYVSSGKKSLKGFIKFILTFGKSNEPKA